MKTGFLNLILLPIIILIIISISSCKPNHSDDFEYIDFSSNADRSQDVYCIKIFKDGRTNIYNCNWFLGAKYYNTITLSKNEIDSVSSLAMVLLNSKIDSVNPNSCTNCYFYRLIIKTKNRKFITNYAGDIYPGNQIKILVNLTSYLDRLNIKAKKSRDTTYIYESWTNNILPPPPPEQPSDLYFAKFAPSNSKSNKN